MIKSPLLALNDVTVKIQLPQQTIHLFEHLNLNIEAGSTHAIMGRSGSGKSTLLALMAGLDTPSHGQISLLGKSWGSLTMDERARWRGQHLGFVFQDFQLVSSMTALDNVVLALDILGRKDPQHRAQEILEILGLGHRLQHRPSMLSGGEQQRVAIARAYAASPSCLLLDEPTGQLDEATGLEILDRLFELQTQFKTTLVFVTHDEYIAQRCAHRYHLEKGHLHAL